MAALSSVSGNLPVLYERHLPRAGDVDARVQDVPARNAVATQDQVAADRERSRRQAAEQQAAERQSAERLAGERLAADRRAAEGTGDSAGGTEVDGSGQFGGRGAGYQQTARNAVYGARVAAATSLYVQEAESGAASSVNPVRARQANTAYRRADAGAVEGPLLTDISI